MAAFGQSTIHSKLAKFERTNEDTSSGNVIKGVNTEYGANKTYKWQQHAKAQIMKQIEILPKSKLNIGRKMGNKRVIPGTAKNEEVVLMESSHFPAIYFKKTVMRNVLKQFTFPHNCQQLSTEQARTTLIYQIVSNLFSEINFYIFNILACQNMENRSYYVFFSDCETLPFTKCCNAPVFVELQENGSGKLLCNSTACEHPNLAEFLINFDDGRRLWPDIQYFAQASSKDRELKHKISRLILNGKYKRQSLVGMVQDTSKEIVNLFYQSKKVDKHSSLYMPEDNTFVTGTGVQNDNGYESRVWKQPVEQSRPQSTEDDMMISQQANIDLLKMKLQYITKKQSDIGRRASKSLMQNCEVFQHDFDIIRRIDEQLLRNKNLKPSSKITFPQLMNQIKSKDKRKDLQNKTFHN